MPIPAANGKGTLPLADLITKSLEAVMQHSLDFINGFNSIAGINHIDKDKIYWCLSVPAIWDEMSKEMMKSCARKAGMRKFELASEPTVATFYVMNTQGKDFRLKAHDKLMILDCGGGTIDAACIEVSTSQWDLTELYHGDGIRAGGLDVDHEFQKLLHQLLPDHIISYEYISQKSDTFNPKGLYITKQ